VSIYDLHSARELLKESFTVNYGTETEQSRTTLYRAHHIAKVSLRSHIGVPRDDIEEMGDGHLAHCRGPNGLGCTERVSKRLTRWRRTQNGRTFVLFQGVRLSLDLAQVRS